MKELEFEFNDNYLEENLEVRFARLYYGGHLNQTAKDLFKLLDSTNFQEYVYPETIDIIKLDDVAPHLSRRLPTLLLFALCNIILSNPIDFDSMYTSSDNLSEFVKTLNKTLDISLNEFCVQIVEEVGHLLLSKLTPEISYGESLFGLKNYTEYQHCASCTVRLSDCLAEFGKLVNLMNTGLSKNWVNRPGHAEVRGLLVRFGNMIYSTIKILGALCDDNFERFEEDNQELFVRIMRFAINLDSSTYTQFSTMAVPIIITYIENYRY